MTFEIVLSASWLGLMTAISPCPMATNVAAIGFIGRTLESTRATFINGLLYTLGRCFGYVLVGSALVYSLLNAPMLSDYLQRYLNLWLGPLLIITGMFLLDMISINIGKGLDNNKLMELQKRYGHFGSFLLGFTFALSFCPVSAALFFGSLMPLAIKFKSAFTLPMIYGAMTSLPVLLFALLIAFGAKKLGQVFNALTKFEKWARIITGVIFILVGIYYSLIYIYGLSL